MAGERPWEADPIVSNWEAPWALDPIVTPQQPRPIDTFFAEAARPPENMWDWWDRTHPGQQAPNDDPRNIINLWAREDPEAALAYSRWHEQTYGSPWLQTRRPLAWGQTLDDPNVLQEMGRNGSLWEDTGPVPLTQAQQFGLGVQSGMSFGFYDETLPPDEAARYRGELEIFRDQNPLLATASEMTGSLPWALAGGAAAAAPRTAFGRTLAGALEGGGSSAAYQMGSGEGDFAERVADVSLPALLTSTAIGGAIPAASALSRPAGRAITGGQPLQRPPYDPTTWVTPRNTPSFSFGAVVREDDILAMRDLWKDTARRLYDEADQMGIAIPQEQLGPVLLGLDQSAFTTRASRDTGAYRLFNNIVADVSDTPGAVSLNQIERHRQDIGNAYRTAISNRNWTEAEALLDMRTTFDNEIAQLIEYAPAREAYLSQMRLDEIAAAATWAANRVNDRPKSFERLFLDRVRTRILEKPNVLRLYTAEQQEAIRAAVRTETGGIAGVLQDLVDKVTNPTARSIASGIGMVAPLFGAPLPTAFLPAIDTTLRISREAARRDATNAMMNALLGVPYVAPAAGRGGEAVLQATNIGAAPLLAPPSDPGQFSGYNDYLIRALSGR